MTRVLAFANTVGTLTLVGTIAGYVFRTEKPEAVVIGALSGAITAVTGFASLMIAKRSQA